MNDAPTRVLSVPPALYTTADLDVLRDLEEWARRAFTSTPSELYPTLREIAYVASRGLSEGEGVDWLVAPFTVPASEVEALRRGLYGRTVRLLNRHRDGVVPPVRILSPHGPSVEPESFALHLQCRGAHTWKVLERLATGERLALAGPGPLHFRGIPR